MTLSEVEIESPNLKMSFSNDLQVSSVTPNLTPRQFWRLSIRKWGNFSPEVTICCLPGGRSRTLGEFHLWDDLLVSLAIDLKGNESLHMHWHQMSSNWSTVSEMPKRILSLSVQAGVTKAKSLVEGFKDSHSLRSRGCYKTEILTSPSLEAWQFPAILQEKQ